jgi:hypothetical protein
VRIFACVRTLNETRNIDRFCRSFAWADRILLADGGSVDDTILKARAYPNVEVREYPVRNTARGVTWNPQGPMCQWLWDWARDEGADWLVMDDCDSVPNTILRKDLPGLIEGHAQTHDIMVAARVYQYGEGKLHFPRMSHAEKRSEWTLNAYFAWRADLSAVKFSDAPIHQGLVPSPVAARLRVLRIEPPYCLIHRFCLDEQDSERKRKVHDAGSNFKQEHIAPLLFGGPLEEMPEWATED